MNTTHKAQHVVPALIVLAIAISVAYLSFTREPAGAFLFPRLIAVVMLTLAVWNFVRAARGLSKVGEGLSLTNVLTILPGVAVLGVYVFYGAEYLGFYVSSSISFFLLFSLYDPASHTKLRSWVRRIIVTAFFMLVIYALFTLLLKVQTPRGIFI